MSGLCEDLRNEFFFRPTANWVAQNSESKGLQAWTQQLTQTSKLRWSIFVFIRVVLMLMMLTILNWNNFVYCFGVGEMAGGSFLTSWVLVPQCTYLTMGVINSIALSGSGGSHFKIAHWRSLITNSLIVTIVYPATMCLFSLYWFYEYPNRKNPVSIMESVNGERIVALGITLSFVATLVDAIIVEQPLFLADVPWVMLFGSAYLIFAQVIHWVWGKHVLMLNGEELDYTIFTENGLSTTAIVSILAIFVALPVSYFFFWLIAHGRNRDILRFNKDKAVRQRIQEQFPVAPRPATKFNPGSV